MDKAGKEMQAADHGPRVIDDLAEGMIARHWAENGPKMLAASEARMAAAIGHSPSLMKSVAVSAMETVTRQAALIPEGTAGRDDLMAVIARQRDAVDRLQVPRVSDTDHDALVAVILDAMDFDQDDSRAMAQDIVSALASRSLLAGSAPASVPAASGEGPPHLLVEGGYWRDPVQVFTGLTWLLAGLVAGVGLGLAF